LETEIVLDYEDEAIAKAVAGAVSPDNSKTPSGMSVETIWKDGKVFTKVKCKRGFPTFIATIDDLLSCISIAEKALRTAKRLG
jgi:tRNA threonylcarbamoyladenosine modification (KEOPS) complex  Pcc1 subunit